MEVLYMLNNQFTKRYKTIPIAKYSFSHTPVASLLPLTKPEIHGEFEIIYIDCGEALITINSRQFTAHSGDLIFISPYMLHSLEIPPQECFKHTCYCFNLSLLADQSVANDLENSKFCITEHISPVSEHHNPLEHSFLAIRYAMDHTPRFWELSVRGNLCLMFAYFATHGMITDNIPAIDRDFCLNIYLYITEHYKEPLTSQSLAKIFDYDQSYFCRLFKRNFSMCFNEYLNRFRIEQSKQLLQNPYLSITDITYETGFSNPSYFTKIFRQQNGMSPSDFRDTYGH